VHLQTLQSRRNSGRDSWARGGRSVISSFRQAHESWSRVERALLPKIGCGPTSRPQHLV
jgi:hypothetical protein